MIKLCDALREDPNVGAFSLTMINTCFVVGLFLSGWERIELAVPLQSIVIRHMVPSVLKLFYLLCAVWGECRNERTPEASAGHTDLFKWKLFRPYTQVQNLMTQISNRTIFYNTYWCEHYLYNIFPYQPQSDLFQYPRHTQPCTYWTEIVPHWFYHLPGRTILHHSPTANPTHSRKYSTIPKKEATRGSFDIPESLALLPLAPISRAAH